MRRPVVRSALFGAAVYATVELSAVALLIWAFGVGWALVVVAATFMAGVVLAASGIRAQVDAGRRVRSDPHGVLADGALVGLGSFLVFLPGVVSTAVGALMLAPPTRTAMRPLAATLVSRGVMRRARAFDFDRYPQFAPHFDARFDAGGPGRGDYIDGEVLGEVDDRLPARR